MSQHSQLGWTMTIIKGFPPAPPELRAGQGAGTNTVENGDYGEEKMATIGKKIIAKDE